MVPAWLHQRLNRKPRRRFRAGASHGPARGGLRLEPLEDRWLLSAGPASTLSLVPGSARAFFTPTVRFDLVSQGSDFVVSLGVPIFVFPVSLLSASFQAVVDWGDGAQSAGVLPATNVTGVNILGSHAYEAPKTVPPQNPAGFSAPQGSDAGPRVPPEVVVTTALDTSRTAGAGFNSGQVFIQISFEGFGEKAPANGPARIDIQVRLLISLAGITEVGATFDGASLVEASAAFSESSEHLPPVPPIPPGSVGPPWRPSPPEVIPSPHPPGFAPPNPPAQSRSSSANLPPVNDPNFPAVTPEAVRDTTRTTSVTADATQDPVVQWLKSRARDLAVLLQPSRDTAGSLDEPGNLFEEITPELAGPSAPAVPIPRHLADDPELLRRRIRNEPGAERRFPEDTPCAGWSAVLFQPDALTHVPAATAAPTIYFGQLNPAEEAEQEAAFASAGSESTPARRSGGRSYRLLLIVGYSLWSLCWFRYGKFPGKKGPAPVGPRRVKPINGPIS